METPVNPALPKIVFLNSENGQTLLREVMKPGGLYQPILHTIFSKQVTMAGCGMQSCALLLSANSLGQQYDAKSFVKLKSSAFDRSLVPYTELGMYSLPETLQVTNSAAVKMQGLTLAEVAQILKSHGCSVKEVHASNSSVAQLRADISDALSWFDSRFGVIINFSRNKLSSTMGYSHHSPVVAYHVATDRILVLDTGIEMADFWVPLEDMFLAMNTKDHVARQSRGYCIASK